MYLEVTNKLIDTEFVMVNPILHEDPDNFNVEGTLDENIHHYLPYIKKVVNISLKASTYLINIDEYNNHSNPDSLFGLKIGKVLRKLKIKNYINKL